MFFHVFPRVCHASKTMRFRPSIAQVWGHPLDHLHDHPEALGPNSMVKLGSPTLVIPICDVNVLCIYTV